jgi:hypothetical protein
VDLNPLGDMCVFLILARRVLGGGNGNDTTALISKIDFCPLRGLPNRNY